MATPKRVRATSSTPRSKKSAAPLAQETTTLQQSQNGNLEEAIRIRAYELFVQRGGTHGHDVEDWVRAQSEISTGAQHSA
jgi:hypothetical protein